MKATRLMSQAKLLRIYKTMKDKPEKVFVLRDFYISNADRVYLNTLIRLGLVEECRAVFRAGAKNAIDKTTKGYRLIETSYKNEIKELKKIINGEGFLVGRNWIEQEELNNLQ